MKLVYGYNNGKFVLAVTTDETPVPNILQRISIPRRECAKIVAAMKFWPEGKTGTIENHVQLIVDKEGNALNLREASSEEAAMHLLPNIDGNSNGEESRLFEKVFAAWQERLWKATRKIRGSDDLGMETIIQIVEKQLADYHNLRAECLR